MEIKDITGLGKGIVKLLEVLSNGVGTLYKPTAIRREAEALAYKESVLGKAKAESKAEEIEILSRANANKLSIIANTKEELRERARLRKECAELQEQRNLDNIFQKALEHGITDENSNDVDPDWFTDFLNFAKNVSSESMQTLWGKILANEIGSPGTYSVRSLELLKRMKTSDLNLFSRFCNHSCNFEGDFTKNCLIKKCVTDPSFSNILWPPKDIEINLHSFKLGFLAIKHLSTMGLIYEDEISFTKEINSQILFFQNASLKLTAKKKKSHLVFYQLTSVGYELASLVVEEVNPKFIFEIESKLRPVFTINKQEGAFSKT